MIEEVDPNEPDSNEPDQASIECVVQALAGTRTMAADSLSQWIREAQADLRRIAHSERVSMNATPTLSTTALISEAYLKFVQSDSQFIDRKHFFATAAKAMRQILLDYARMQVAQKRGSGSAHESLDVAIELPAAQLKIDELLAVDTALERMRTVLPRAARVVELRYFGGLDDREAGEVLVIEESTVRRDWLKARAWLLMHFGGRE